MANEDKRIIEQPGTLTLYNDDWLLTDRATEGEDGGTRKIQASQLKKLFNGEIVADEWVALTTYNRGAFVTHEGKLYYNNSGGALVQTTFNSSAWLEVKVDSILKNMISSIALLWESNGIYYKNDLVMYGGSLYYCCVSTSTQGTWKSTEWMKTTTGFAAARVQETVSHLWFYPSETDPPVVHPYYKGDLILYKPTGYDEDTLFMCLVDLPNGDTEWIPEHWLAVYNVGGALKKIYEDMAESDSVDDIVADEVSLIDENKVADLTPLAMIGTASGDIASFDEGSGLPFKSVVANIEPVQDLHGYDHPWVGGAGKNIYPLTVDNIKETQGGAETWTGNTKQINYLTAEILTDSDGNCLGIKLDGTVSVSGNTLNIQLNTNMTLSAGTYILSGSVGGSSSTYRLNLRNGSTIIATNFGSDATFTLSESSSTIRLTITLSNNYHADNLIIRPMIRLSTESDSTFAPYSNICPISGWDEVNVTVADDVDNPTVENVYIIDLDGTRYGGTLDVVSGLMTLDRLYVDMGTLSWEMRPNTNNVFQADVTNIYVPTSSSERNKGMMCSIYKLSSITYLDDRMEDESMCRFSGKVLVRDTSYQDATTFKTAMNGVQLVYYVETPIEVQLTPTQVKSLPGVNKLRANTGSIKDAEFIEDATTVINSLIARIEALENA